MKISEERFNNILEVILNIYRNKGIDLSVDSISHQQGLIVLKLNNKTKCPKCIRTSIQAKLKRRFGHIKQVQIIR